MSKSEEEEAKDKARGAVGFSKALGTAFRIRK